MASPGGVIARSRARARVAHCFLARLALARPGQQPTALSPLGSLAAVYAEV